MPNHLGHVEMVDAGSLSIERFAEVIGAEAATRFEDIAGRAREELAGRTVWNVSSTAAGGGVAEMLARLVAYGRGLGVDTRWAVIKGDQRFFTLTKRVHNLLHGVPGDGTGLSEADRAHYEAVIQHNAQDLRDVVRAGDIVVVHDPQPAGLVPLLVEVGAHVVWRSHIGTELHNENVRSAWQFLRPYIEPAAAFVFTRATYLPPFLDADSERVHIIAPSIDPFSVKNQEMDEQAVAATVTHLGLARGGDPDERARFERRDGSPGRVDRVADLLTAGAPPPLDAPLIVQVSRWDTLKDMAGVMESFAEHVAGERGAHLALVGPTVAGVSDDPEGAEVFARCAAQWRELPHVARSHIALVTLPMDDIDENAAMVNAIQRHATIVVQKSLQEGFGLTVAEAMWKGRPIVASAVGGIQDQITDGEHGLLLDDPADGHGFADRLLRLLHDPELASSLGEAARERARTKFLGDRHLIEYGVLFLSLLES